MGRTARIATLQPFSSGSGHVSFLQICLSKTRHFHQVKEKPLFQGFRAVNRNGDPCRAALFDIHVVAPMNSFQNPSPLLEDAGKFFP